MATEKPEDCECCEFETEELKEFSSSKNFPHVRDETKWLCGLCATTMTGAFHDYPEQHDRDSLYVMKTVCHVGNAIIAEIRKLRS